MKTMLKEWGRSPKGTMAYLLGVIMVVICSTINTRLIYLISRAVDDYTNLRYHLPEIMLCCIANITLCPLNHFLKGTGIALIYNDMDTRFNEKILSIPYSAFVSVGTDRAITVGGYLNMITSGLKFTTQIIEIAIHLVVTISAIYLIDQSSIVPILIVYGVMLMLLNLVNKKVFVLDERKHDKIKKRNKERIEVINAFHEVRSFCTEHSHYKSLVNKTEDVYAAIREQKIYGGAFSGLIELADALGLICILVYATKSIVAGELTPATAVSLVMYVWAIIGPLTSLTDITIELMESLSVMKDYDAFMAIPKEKDGDIELKSFSDSIKFENLSFSYNDSDNVLNGINLTIKKGQKIGICGHSGGGKSTLLKLIPALYRDFEGSLTIDGIDVRSLTKESLRSKIGYVNQDVHIFDSTIYDNIAYGNPNATMYDVIDACKKAAIYDFIQGLPDKFNTKVGPRGLKLSGGQKQRISLARVFLKNADIILLDEATSALDNEAENIIQESLAMFEDKTVITVAHRLSTIKSSDEIVVIGNHSIVERGTHEELMEQNGVYASLYNAKENQTW